ncbi:MAG: hypothetical protein ACI4RT_08575 [Candidatus Spyradenecus sp.]
MKSVTLIMFWFILMAFSGCFAHQPVASVTLQVVNQEDSPVTDAEIIATFEQGLEDLLQVPDEDGEVVFSSEIVWFLR